MLPDALAPLVALRQWVTYRLSPNGKGKMDKLPCHWASGQVSSAQEPGSWTTYEQALAHQHLADRGHGCGVGFVFSPGDPFWFVDIDNCLMADGSWSTLATDLCRRLKGAAVEVSQSGRGLHIIGSGIVPAHRCKNIPLGLELYTERRFIAITGTHARGSCTADLTDAMTAVVAEFFAPKVNSRGVLEDWTNEPCEEWNGPLDDDELIRRARAYVAKPSVASRLGLRSGSALATPDAISFDALWTADVGALAEAFPDTGSQGRSYDASSADMSLAMRLAYWTGRDCARIESLMRMSGLMREKYERTDYIERTIMNAAGLVENVCQDRKRPEPVAPGPPVEITLTGRGEPRTLTLSAGEAEDKQNHLAIEQWFGAAGYRASYDEFADRLMLNDEPLTDNRERRAWLHCRELSHLKFPKELFADVMRDIAWSNRFHPLRNWLAENETAWDGRPRIDTWLPDYLGVEDSPYVRAISAIFLTAAVRRIREPGAKFDEILVLEGPQGLEKSSAVASLAPLRDWFTDNFTVSMNAKELLEQTMGKWLVEAPELSKLRDAEIEHVKHLLSRQFDRARMAYDKSVTDRGRHWVGFATVNADRYLTDPTGNRRFWPVRCGPSIDLRGIERDRDQLWAEAAQRESAGASIRLPANLWDAAAAEQADRMVIDPFVETLSELLASYANARIRTSDLWMILGIPFDRRQHAGKKLSDAMRGMGWTKRRLRDGGSLIYWYCKGNEIQEINVDPVTRALNIAKPDLTVVR